MYNISSPITPIKGMAPKEKAMEGGKWKIVEKFNGRSHQNGGIDILVSGGKVQRIHAPYHKPEEYAGWGSFWKSVGATAYGLGEGLLDTVTLGATDQLTDMGYEALQKLGGSSDWEIREQNSLRGYGTTAGAVTGGILTGGAATGSAIQQGSKGLGAGVAYGSPDDAFSQQFGTWVPLAGGIAGMAVGNAGYDKNIKALTEGAKAAEAAGDTAKAAQLANRAAQLSQFSNIATKAGNIAKYTPFIGAGLNMLGGRNAPQMMGGMMGGQIPTTPEMPLPMSRAQRSTGGGPSGGPGTVSGAQFSNTPLSYAGASGEEGPIQFRMPPIYQAESAQYLGKYGVNV